MSRAHRKIDSILSSLKSCYLCFYQFQTQRNCLPRYLFIYLSLFRASAADDVSKG
uniref:Protein disulfide-isomerase n=1 Tax=Phakopsora pachyrhizi TaxID=170000 RepID=A0A0S1MIB3_PHAPC